MTSLAFAALADCRELCRLELIKSNAEKADPLEELFDEYAEWKKALSPTAYTTELEEMRGKLPLAGKALKEHMERGCKSFNERKESKLSSSLHQNLV